MESYKRKYFGTDGVRDIAFQGNTGTGMVSKDSGVPGKRNEHLGMVPGKWDRSENLL